MKFLVICGESREELSREEAKFTDGFKAEIKKLMDISGEFIVQRFDRTWEEWVNVKFEEVLLDKQKLKCVVKEEVSLISPVPKLCSSPVTSRSICCDHSDSDMSLSGPMSPISVNTSGVGRVPNVSQLEGRMTVILRDALDGGKDLTWQLKHELLQILCDALYKINKYPSTNVKDKYARDLVATYPYLKDRLGEGHCSWIQKLNNGLKAMRNRDSSLTERKRKLKCEINSAVVKVAKRGEINWQPEVDDDPEIIKAHQQLLRREHGKDLKSQNKEKIQDLMNVTYGSRRDLIINEIPIKDLKDLYPCLFTETQLYREFERLMVKELDKIFFTAFPDIAQSLVNISHLRKKKVSRDIDDILSTFKKAPVGNDATNNMVAALLLLPHVLKETADSFYINVAKEKKSPADALDVTADTTPVMVIVGDPFTTDLVYIIAEEQVLLECHETAQAACLLFAVYYVCNIIFPKKATSTFTFLQKFVFGLSDTVKIPGKVQTLASSLEIVMTPLRGSDGHVIKVERVPESQLNKKKVQHIAGGPYQGIVINKAASKEKPSKKAGDTERAFTAHVFDTKAGKNEQAVRERRILRFWFASQSTGHEETTNKFFEDLMNPKNFPRDPISFVTRVLNLMRDYRGIKKLELEMRPPKKGEDDGMHVTQQVTTVTTTTVKKTVPGGTQEDVKFTEDGTPISAGGTWHNGSPGTAGYTPHGAVLDRSRRAGPNQEDVSFQKDAGLHGAHGQYAAASAGMVQASDEGPIMAAWASPTGGQGNPYYASELLAASATGGDIVETVDIAPQTATRTGGTRTGMMEDSVEEVIVPASASTTGDRGNPHYASQLTKSATKPATKKKTKKTGKAKATKTKKPVEEEVITAQTGNTTGGSGNPHYASQLNAETEVAAAKNAEVQRQPSISRKGWQVVWATKKQRLLTTLEDAYPNIMAVDDLVRETHLKRADVEYLLSEIKEKGAIQEIDQGWWVRAHKVEKKVKILPDDDKGMPQDTKPAKKHDFKIVSHIPRLPPKEQPSVALVTLQYSEKIAVDAMMDMNTTYMRYKADGEGQVYTVGKIGKHRVVSTKLSRIGVGQSATVSAGNTITRLLGTFNKIEHVILVGVGGGVPSYRDDTRHVRLGDIVVSKPEYTGAPIYIYCQGVEDDPSGGVSFNTISWNTKDDMLEKIIANFQRKQTNNIFSFSATWEKYIDEALDELDDGEGLFLRPSPESDILYKTVDGNTTDVDHPPTPSHSPRSKRPNAAVVHYGVIGSGKKLAKDDNLRQQFAVFNEVMCLDSGFQAVMESIEGNRKDSFAIIRGVSDYTDGTTRKEWLPYAALNAAAYMKALLLEIPAEDEDDEY